MQPGNEAILYIYLIIFSEERGSVLHQQFAYVDVGIPRSFMQRSLLSGGGGGGGGGEIGHY